MMTKAKTKEELLEIREELLKQQAILDRKFTRNRNAIKKIEAEETKCSIEEIPKDINKITKKQWEWILYHYHDEAEGHYKFATDFLYNNFGLAGISGFVSDEVKQFKFSLHKHMKEDFFKAFDFLKKHLKETTQTNRKNIKITGIPFAVFDVDDYISPTAYYNKKNRHVYVVTHYGNITEHKSMKAFEKWYDLEIEGNLKDDSYC